MGIKIDITQKDLKNLLILLKQFLPNTLVWAFGSRVKFTAQPSSDLDLVAFINKEQEMKFSLLNEELSESDLPFRVDLHNWNEIPDIFKQNIKDNFVVIQDNVTEVLLNSCKTNQYLPTQKEISQILSSIDDKIKINLQMNQTLQAMAQAIHKECSANYNFNNNEKLIEFKNFEKTIYERIDINKKNIQALIETGDTLLLKFMSG